MNFWRDIIMMQKEISGKKMISDVMAAEREHWVQKIKEFANSELQTAIEKTCNYAKSASARWFILSDRSTTEFEFTLEGYLEKSSSYYPEIVVRFCVYAKGYTVYWPDNGLRFWWPIVADDNPNMTATNLVRILDEEFSRFFEVETGNVEFTSETSSSDRQIFKKSVVIEF